MKTVYFDIDTQIDVIAGALSLWAAGFQNPQRGGAAAASPPLEIQKIKDRLYMITGGCQCGNTAVFETANGVVVVSDMCAHSEDDPEFRDWPPHCVVGTTGQLKPQSTMLEKRAVVPNTPAEIAVEGAEQIILEKQQLDLFTNPNLKRLLEILKADEYVVYGVVTEYCVGFAARGLLDTGRPVTLVTDAIRSLRDEDASRTIEDFARRGGRVATSAELIGI